MFLTREVMQRMHNTQEEVQDEATVELMRLYKVAYEAQQAAVQYEARVAAGSLLALMDEHPEVTSFQYDVEHDYDRRSNSYSSFANFRFYVDETEVEEDWVWEAEQAHGWSREALELLGEEEDTLTRDDLRKHLAGAA